MLAIGFAQCKAACPTEGRSQTFMHCRPMARGMLTGKLDLKNLPDNDFRKGGHNPQFNEDNVDGVSTKLLVLLQSADEIIVLYSLRSSSCAMIAALAYFCC